MFNVICGGATNIVTFGRSVGLSAISVLVSPFCYTLCCLIYLKHIYNWEELLMFHELTILTNHVTHITLVTRWMFIDAMFVPM